MAKVIAKTGDSSYLIEVSFNEVANLVGENNTYGEEFKAKAPLRYDGKEFAIGKEFSISEMYRLAVKRREFNARVNDIRKQFKDKFSAIMNDLDELKTIPELKESGKN